MYFFKKKTPQNNNTTAQNVQPVIQKRTPLTIKDHMHNHVLMLNAFDIGDKAGSVSKKDNKRGYVIITNTAMEQCNVDKESFNDSFAFKSGNDDDKEKITSLLEMLSQVKAIEGSVVGGGTDATAETLQNAKKHIERLASAEPMNDWYAERLQQLKNMNVNHDVEGYFIFSVALLTGMISQVYDRNMKANNIESKAIQQSKPNRMGKYSIKYGINTLADMMRDITDGYRVKHPETGIPRPETDEVVKERQEKERQEKERQEKERQEKERQEQERQEKERQEKERQEKERLEKETQEKEIQGRLEKERLEKETQEKLEKERLEKETQEKLEKERLEKETQEKLEKERLEKETQEKLEKERVEKELQEKLEKERLEKELQEKQEKERLEQEALRKIATARKRSMCYIMTASFEDDAVAPEEWYLAPFADAVMAMMADNLAFENMKNGESVFKTKVCKINDNIREIFYSVSKIVGKAAENHEYLANSNIADMVKEKVLEELTGDSKLLDSENNDKMDSNGVFQEEGNTTKHIRESIKSQTDNMDKKLNSFFTVAEGHRPQLALCHTNMQACPELMAYVFDEKLTKGEDIYRVARTLLKQADKNISLLMSLLNEDSDTAGDILFLRKIIEKCKESLFVDAESYFQDIILIEKKAEKKNAGNKLVSKGLINQKVADKCENDGFLKKELMLRLAQLAPGLVTEQEVDKQIEQLLQNKKNNQETLVGIKENYYRMLTQEEDKHIYKKELVQMMQRYLSLNADDFARRVAFACKLLCGKTVEDLTGAPVVKQQTAQEAVKEKAVETDKAAALALEKKLSEQQFNMDHRKAITFLAGDYNKNLLHGFTYTALRLNDDKGEATSSREQRMKDGSAALMVKAAPQQGKKDQRSIVEKYGSPAGIIDFVASFRISPKNATSEEQIYSTMSVMLQGENATLLRYIEYIHENAKTQSKGKDQSKCGLRRIVAALEKPENVVYEYESYLKYIGLKANKKEYVYYGTEEYRIQIEQIMGDNFGMYNREDFEKKLLEIEMKTGYAIGNATEKYGNDARKFKQLMVTDDAQASENGRIVDESLKQMYSKKKPDDGQQSLDQLAATLKSRVNQVLQQTKGRFELLIPHMLEDAHVYQVLLGNEEEFTAFMTNHLPTLSERMEKLYSVFSEERSYYISMALKKQIDIKPGVSTTLGGMIVSPVDGDEASKQNTIYLSAKSLEQQKVTKRGGAHGKSADDLFHELTMKAADGKTAASDNIGIQRLLMSGRLDAALLNQRITEEDITIQLKQAKQNGESIMNTKAYQNEIIRQQSRIKECSAAKVDADKQFDIFNNLHKSKSPKEQSAEKNELSQRLDSCRKANIELKWAKEAERTLEKLIMEYFANSLLDANPMEFKKSVEKDVGIFLQEQEKSRKLGIDMEIADGDRKKRAKELRAEILTGESDFKKQKNRSEIIRYIDNKQVSAANQMKLTERIEAAYEKKINIADNAAAAKEVKSGIARGNIGIKGQMELDQEKAVHEKAMSEAVAGVTGNFVSKNKQTTREKMLSPLKRYIAVKDGGQSEVVQSVVAELLFEKNVDAESKKSQRQYDEVGNRFTADDAMVAAIKNTMDKSPVAQPITKSESEEEVAQRQQIENELAKQIDDSADKFAIQSDKKKQEKEEKKAAKTQKKAEQRAARKAEWSTKKIDPVIKAVGDIYRILTVCLEAIDVSENYLEWAMSSMVMKYGDNLTKLTGDALIAAVYGLANEFKVKQAAFEIFTSLNTVAEKHIDTYMEYKDRVHILSIQLGSMDVDEFCDTCRKANTEFSLYCYSYISIGENVALYAKQHVGVGGKLADDSQQKKAVHSMLRIMRGRIGAGTVTDIEGLDKEVHKLLSDRLTFDLLIQDGHTTGAVGSDDIAPSTQPLYNIRDSKAFENFLIDYKYGFNYYKALSDRERAVFFAVLGCSTMLAHSANSTAESSMVIRQYATKGNDELECGRVIMDYANGEEIAYTPIDYGYAIDALVTTGVIEDSKVNKSVFSEVKKIMRGLREARRAHRDLNSEVLDHSQEQVMNMVYSSKTDDIKKKLVSDTVIETAKAAYTEQMFHDFLKALYSAVEKQTDSKGKDNLQKLINLAESTDPNEKKQFYIIIGILQNRSIVDEDRRGDGLESNIKDKYKEHSEMSRHFANEAGRSDFIEQFSQDGSNNIERSKKKKEIWMCAAHTLISYQVSGFNEVDDAAKLSMKDIVGANRKSMLDSNMLRNAFDLMHKVAGEANRNRIMDTAQENIDREDARKIYEEYDKVEDNDISTQTFDNFILSQYSSDTKMDSEMKWAARGYMLLPPVDKELLFAILSDRRMIDLTKKGIGRERAGLSQEARQQVNSEDRLELMEEYVSRGKVEIGTSTRRQAINSLLSSQYNDEAARKGKKESSTRSTTLDWKLFRRAMEFVHMCHSARENFTERRELERALLGGDSHTGFREELDLYGSNEQRAGNRFTHIAGRTAKSIGLGMVNDHVRDGLGHLAFMLAKNPEQANTIAGMGILSDASQERVDAKAEKRSELGGDQDGAKISEETIAKIFSTGQQTIFGKMREAANAEVVKEMFNNENVAGTTTNLVEKAGDIVGKLEGINPLSGKSYGEQKESFNAAREELKRLAAANGTEVNSLLSEKLGDSAGQVGELVGIVADGRSIYKLAKTQHEAKKVHESQAVNQHIEKLSTVTQSDASAAIRGKDKAWRGAQSGMSFAKSAKVQSIVEHAINFISTFAELGDGVDPTGLLAKLVEAGFTSLTAAINGIINYCTSLSNMHDFIRLDGFDKQLASLAAGSKNEADKKELEKVIGMKDVDKKNIWIQMHGMDKSDAINYVGKETVYALKFCVSNSCRLPYLKSMGTLIFATLGFGISNGKVMADNAEIFDKLLGSR